MEKLKYLIKKKGFWNIIEIFKDTAYPEMTMREFYKKLNEISYYNAFIRIKAFLLENDLIFLVDKNIGLTEKGAGIIRGLQMINGFLETENFPLIKEGV